MSTNPPSIEPAAGVYDLVTGRHGRFLANRNDVYVGRALIRYGEYGEIEWRMLAQICKPGDAVIEIGANIGSHTVALAKAVGPGGRVMAIEPQPFVFQNLCANLALNGLANVDAMNCGMGREEGILSLPAIDYAREGNFGGVSLGAGTRGIPVPVRRLDDVMRYPRLRLIKIDVEGMEAAVIEGARATIQRFKPVLYVENDRVDRSQALIELLRGLGYRMWWHMPALYNADNFFKNAADDYPGIVSINMLAIHESAGTTVSRLQPVTDASDHPLKPQPGRGGAAGPGR